MPQIPNYWIEDHLPNGTPIAPATYWNGVIADWPGLACKICKGPGEDSERDDGLSSCRHCAGTGDEYGPVFLVEE